MLVEVLMVKLLDTKMLAGFKTSCFDDGIVDTLVKYRSLIIRWLIFMFKLFTRVLGVSMTPISLCNYLTRPTLLSKRSNKLVLLRESIDLIDNFLNVIVVLQWRHKINLAIYLSVAPFYVKHTIACIIHMLLKIYLMLNTAAILFAPCRILVQFYTPRMISESGWFLNALESSVVKTCPVVEFDGMRFRRRI